MTLSKLLYRYLSVISKQLIFCLLCFVMTVRLWSCCQFVSW